MMHHGAATQRTLWCSKLRAREFKMKYSQEDRVKDTLQSFSNLPRGELELRDVVLLAIHRGGACESVRQKVGSP
jgi:hypothetical protein